jgi:L-ascorbate metabolism protein UlaG (beta-lactamase superfamily)
MNITKLGHCCLLIEIAGKRVLTDPGAWSTLQNDVRDIDLILITHEHTDHLHIESLEQVLKNNPQAKIVTNSSVGKLLAAKSIPFEVLEDGRQATVCEISLEAFGTAHAEIFAELGQVQNTGFFINDILFYPGDAFTLPGKPVDVLALPIVGPWTSFKQAMNYAIQIHPRVCFPVHDGMLISDRPGPTYRLPPQILAAHGIEFVVIGVGETKEF